MFVKQVSVFVENSAGRLAELTRLLADHGVDLISMSIADTASFGIVRFITTSVDEAVKLSEGSGYTARVNDVLAVMVDDRPGGLAGILDILNRNGIAVEYMYSFNRSLEGKALIVIRVNDSAAAEKAFAQNSVRMIGQEDLRDL